ncbi:MAG: response regulator [Candidatus Thermoplasmatota archaeon]|nr:response regulator [Candidatus Thermoplasmatota archaeon]
MSKVLIVEDAPFIREMIRDILESHDHEIAGEAANGLEAIEKFKALKPDVVLMDILMPGMDGLSAIMKIMEIDPKAKIIVVSALVKEALKKEAMRAGAVDFVAKPFQVERLLEAVRVATTAACWNSADKGLREEPQWHEWSVPASRYQRSFSSSHRSGVARSSALRPLRSSCPAPRRSTNCCTSTSTLSRSRRRISASTFSRTR